MKRYLPFIIVVGIALATFGSGAMLYHAKHPQLQAIPEDKAVPANSGAESIHIRGNPNAPVTLEEFGDFQCPPCGSFAAFGEELLKEYDSRVRLIFRHFPLSVHEHAREASLAAEAAGLQGHFWEMHDTLYHEQAACLTLSAVSNSVFGQATTQQSVVVTAQEAPSAYEEVPSAYGAPPEFSRSRFSNAVNAYVLPP